MVCEYLNKAVKQNKTITSWTIAEKMTVEKIEQEGEAE